MTRAVLALFFMVVYCSSLGSSSPLASASASAEDRDDAADDRNDAADDRDVAADDREEKSPSDLQLLVPMVMVDEGSPSQGRSGTNQPSDSSSSEEEVCLSQSHFGTKQRSDSSGNEEDESLSSSLKKIVQLLSELHPRQTVHITPLTPRPRVLPSRPAILNDDEECPACFILHALQVMEQNLEKGNNVGQLYNQAEKHDQVARVRNNEAPADLTYFWDQYIKRWKQNKTKREEKSKGWDHKSERWAQKLKRMEQRLVEKANRWHQKGQRLKERAKHWAQKGQRLNLEEIAKRLAQKGQSQRLEEMIKLLAQKGQLSDKTDEHLNQNEQAGREGSQGCVLCFFESGSMNRRAGNAPDAGPAPELPAPQGKGPTP